MCTEERYTQRQQIGSFHSSNRLQLLPANKCVWQWVCVLGGCYGNGNTFISFVFSLYFLFFFTSISEMMKMEFSGCLVTVTGFADVCLRHSNLTCPWPNSTCSWDFFFCSYLLLCKTLQRQNGNAHGILRQFSAVRAGSSLICMLPHRTNCVFTLIECEWEIGKSTV